jgi:N-acetylmuramoyl-L-alanine amidase
VLAARLWPARDYTRLTLESKDEIKYEVLLVNDPARLVLDLEGVEMGPVLAELDKKVSEADPHVKGMRAARNRPGVVRVVIDLKTDVNPQVFTLRPIADYGHRLVVDLHPSVPYDPLLALLESAGPDAAAAEAAPDKTRPGKRAPKAQVARLATIVIDAGHGGEDPGARGRRGTREKDVTLMIARRLKALIDAEPRMRAVLTRDGDYYLGLGDRAAKARKVRADLFVSIHADAFVRPHARGSSVFALSERRATSVAAEWLAKKENEADLVGGVNLDVKDPYLKRTLADLTVTGNIDHSLKLGGAVLKELGQVNTLHKRHVEQAGFAVLKTPNVPSILVETAFISNPQEEKKLKNRAYQDRLARALLAGIKRYLDKHPPRPQPTLASN